MGARLATAIVTVATSLAPLESVTASLTVWSPACRETRHRLRAGRVGEVVVAVQVPRVRGDRAVGVARGGRERDLLARLRRGRRDVEGGRRTAVGDVHGVRGDVARAVVVGDAQADRVDPLGGERLLGRVGGAVVELAVVIEVPGAACDRAVRVGGGRGEGDLVAGVGVRRSEVERGGGAAVGDRDDLGVRTAARRRCRSPGGAPCGRPRSRT